MREVCLIAFAAAAVLPAAAAARDSAVYFEDGPLRGSLRRDEPAPVYSTDSRDPWNRLFHLLYARELRVKAADPMARPHSIRRLEGGDLPEFLFPPDAAYLLEGQRNSRLRTALEAELRRPSLSGRTPEARLLFQQDLWSRFDALQALGTKEPRAARLARLLARLMGTVALRAEEIGKMRFGFAQAAEAHPDLVDPGLFEPGSPWKELVSHVDLETGGGTTLHARRAGWRLVFRRFVRVPPDAGGEACLRNHLLATHGPARSVEAQEGPCGWRGLPPGTAALLLETPLAISAEGELLAVPLVLAAEARRVRPEGDFAVLHAPRLAVSASPRRLVLESFEDGDLVPLLGASFPRADGDSLVPVRQSCVLCHGPDGSKLGTGSLQIPPQTEVLSPANTVEADRVLRTKRRSEAFRALLEDFRRR